MNPFESNIEEYLVNPIWVENSKTSKLAPCTLLSHRPQITLELQLGNTLIFGFPIHNTLAHRPLPAPSAHSNAVDYVALHRGNDSFFKKLETRDRHWLSKSRILQHIPGLTRDRRGGRAGENKTCLALNPRRRALSGRVGRVMRTMPGNCLYSQHLTRSRNRSTSDCFFLQSSSTYLYAPAYRNRRKDQDPTPAPKFRALSTKP